MSPLHVSRSNSLGSVVLKNFLPDGTKGAFMGNKTPDWMLLGGLGAFAIGLYGCVVGLGRGVTLASGYSHPYPDWLVGIGGILSMLVGAAVMSAGLTTRLRGKREAMGTRAVGWMVVGLSALTLGIFVSFYGLDQGLIVGGYIHPYPDWTLSIGGLVSMIVGTAILSEELTTRITRPE